MLRAFKALDTHLGDGRKWVTGSYDITLADLALSMPVLNYFGKFMTEEEEKEIPHVRDYLNRLMQHPAVKETHPEHKKPQSN